MKARRRREEHPFSIAYRERTRAAVEAAGGAGALVASVARTVVEAIASTRRVYNLTTNDAIRASGGFSALITACIGPEPKPEANDLGMPTSGVWWVHHFLSMQTLAIRNRAVAIIRERAEASR